MSTQFFCSKEVMMVLPTQQDVCVEATGRPVAIGGKVKNRKERRRGIKGLRLVGRISLFLFLYLVWPLFRKWLKPAIVFAIYGTAKDKRAYFPDWLGKRLRTAFPAGLIRYQGRWGLVSGTAIAAEDFDQNPACAFEYVEAIKREFPKAQVVALAGRLPGWVHRFGHELQAPFVTGTLGTRYAMLSAARQAAEKHGDCSQNLSVGLLGGAGFTGSMVAQDVAEEFGKVIAFDPRFTNTEDAGKIRTTSDTTQLSRMDVAIVLTGKGDDIADLVSHFTHGTVVADDTHPCISPSVCQALRKRGVCLYKAVMRGGRMRMIPRMPNFRGDNIPGCLLEALVVLQQGQDVLQSPDVFFRVAAELGFRAELMRHPDD